MSKVATAFAFVLGAAAGSVTAWYFTKKTYERIAQEEIDSVKETFSKLYKRDDSATQDSEDSSDDEEEEEDLDIIEYAAIAEHEGYINYADIGSCEAPKSDKFDPPYVIPPESFDELEAYDVVSLSYYEDKVLTDDTDNIIEDMEGLTGFSTPEELEGHFGEYEDDSIFVRNDRLRCDIEILHEPRTYADVLKKEPYKAEVR